MTNRRMGAFCLYRKIDNNAKVGNNVLKAFCSDQIDRKPVPGRSDNLFVQFKLFNINYIKN